MRRRRLIYRNGIEEEYDAQSEREDPPAKPRPVPIISGYVIASDDAGHNVARDQDTK